jgi:hypothetical protein
MITDKLLIAETYQLPENLKEEVFHYIDFLKKNYTQSALSALKKPKNRTFGSAKDKYHLSADFDAPLEWSTLFYPPSSSRL